MIFLYGASGHAKVILETLELANRPVKALFDDNPDIQQLGKYKVTAFPGSFDAAQDELVLSVGNNRIRRQLAERLQARFASAIHPRACISASAAIGAGTVVMAGVTVNADTVIGRHCILNTNSSVDHDCVLGDYVHVSPNAALCGGVTVGEGAHIGAGAVVIPGVKIGKWAVIGAGAVVINDIPDNATVVGNPAKRKL